MDISCHCQPIPALKHIFLQCHNQAVVPGQMCHQFRVHRLHEPSIGKGAGITFLFQLFPDMLTCADHASHCQKGNVLFLVKHLTFAVCNGLPEFPQPTVGLPPGVTDGQRTVIFHGKIQHGPKLPQVLGGHDAHVRDAGKIRIIKNPLMCLPIAAHKPCPVHCKQHGQVLDTDIVKHLVKSPL